MATPQNAPDSSRPVTLVTGAGSGIGRAVCAHLAQEVNGHHRLALVGRRADALAETGSALGAEGDDWIALPTDIADPDAAAGLVDRAVRTLGRLDAVVNNAGWTPMKPVWAHTPSDVASIMGVNTIGPVLITIAALRHFREQGAGRIVQVSSMAAGDPFPGLSVYGGAKAALNTLTKGIANELEEGSPIKAFCVAPGAVETELLRSIIDADTLPTDACLTPDDVAAVINDCIAGRRDADHGSTIWLASS